jgi:hypothetical protein
VRDLILFVFYFCFQHITYRPGSPHETESDAGDTTYKDKTPTVHSNR